MVSQAIRFLSQLPIPISHNYYPSFADDNYTNSKTRRHRCFSGGCSRWDWDKNVNPNRRSRFSDAYVSDDYDEEDEYGFRNATKQRMWWSDDFYADDDEEDEGFGILKDSIGSNWVLKVFRAFGWMIPAVIISLLVGTGPNAIIMAIALPLAQSALSLVADTLWGTSYETPKPKFKKSKKRPFGASAGRKRVKQEKEISFQAGKEKGNYKSWVDANNVSDKIGKRSRPNFGGWDELDKEPRVTPIKHADEPRVQQKVNISKRTKGDTQLLMRLLIAMFTYLGFWTKLF